jgi:hypothetical protein
MSRYNIIDKKTTEYKFPETYSSILQETKTNDIIINGVNVITKTPSVGDVLCITRNKTSNNTLAGPESQNIVWVKGSTFNFDSFRGDLYEPVGIVYNVIGRIAYVAYRTYGSRAYADVKIYKLEIPDDLISNEPDEGFSITLTYKKNDTIVNVLDQKIISSKTSKGEYTKKQFIKNLDEALYGTDFWTWSVQYINDTCFLYVPWDYTNINIDSIACKDGKIRNISIRLNQYVDMPSDTQLQWNICKIRSQANVDSGFGGGVYLDRVIEYYENDPLHGGGGASELPSDFIYNIYGTPGTTGALPVMPVCRELFNDVDKCGLLQDTFGTYENYIKEVEMVEWPHHNVDSDAIGYSFNKGKELTNILIRGYSDGYPKGEATYVYRFGNSTLLPPGNTKAIFQAADYCNSISINHTKLVEGNWFMPTMSDIYMMVKNNDLISDIITRLNNGGDKNNGFNFDVVNVEGRYWVVDPSTKNNYAWFYAGGSFNGQKPSNMYEVIPVIQIDF